MKKGENDKMKKSGKVILIIIVVLLLVAVAVGGYVLIKNNNEYNEKIAELENKIEEKSGKTNSVENEEMNTNSNKEDNKNTVVGDNSTSNENTAKESNTISNESTTKNSTEISSKGYTYDNLKGTYIKKVETESADGSAYEMQYKLYLNNDCSFVYYAAPDTDCHLVGYYIINDNKISLHCVLSYGNDPSISVVSDIYELSISDAKTLNDNDIAKGNLEKTSNSVDINLNLSEAANEAAKSEYFSAEDEY